MPPLNGRFGRFRKVGHILLRFLSFYFTLFHLILFYFILFSFPILLRIISFCVISFLVYIVLCMFFFHLCYAGGKFELYIDIPESYPFNPPKVSKSCIYMYT